MFIKTCKNLEGKTELNNGSKLVFNNLSDKTPTVYFDENRKTNTYILYVDAEDDKVKVIINTQTLSFSCMLDENEELKEFFKGKGIKPSTGMDLL